MSHLNKASMSAPKKHTIQDMQDLAESRQGKCLSKKYVNNRTKLKWKCSENHKWTAPPAGVTKGKWCSKCAVNLRRHSIEKMQVQAEKHGGRCLSKKYINSKTKLKWKCDKGHRFDASPNHIIQGRWCPTCGYKKAAESRTKPFERYKVFAKKKRGKCISDSCSNNLEKLVWECRKGHQWKATPNDVCNHGTWCPVCANKKMSRNRMLSLEDMHVLAGKRKGKCLSKRYYGVTEKLVWECELKHKWKTSPNSIKQGSWCPVCARKKKWRGKFGTNSIKLKEMSFVN